MMSDYLYHYKINKDEQTGYFEKMLAYGNAFDAAIDAYNEKVAELSGSVNTSGEPLYKQVKKWNDIYMADVPAMPQLNLYAPIAGNLAPYGYRYTDEFILIGINSPISVLPDHWEEISEEDFDGE